VRESVAELVDVADAAQRGVRVKASAESKQEV
jgi:hypothetical protein